MNALEEHLERFRTYLAEQGLRLTLQRRAIAEVFFAGDKHLSLGEILDLTKEKRGGIGYATVYRTMRLLADAGFASEHKFGEAQTRYEPAVDGEHHDHLICLDCGRILEFEDPEIESAQERAARSRGFEVVSHKHEIYVHCVADCDEKQARRRPG